MTFLNATDFAILDQLASGRRNVAANVAMQIEANRNYVNNRFRHLAAHGLIKRIGPSEASGLYEITRKGQLALEHRQKANDEELDFDAFLDQQLSERESASPA